MDSATVGQGRRAASDVRLRPGRPPSEPQRGWSVCRRIRRPMACAYRYLPQQHAMPVSLQAGSKVRIVECVGPCCSPVVSVRRYGGGDDGDGAGGVVEDGLGDGAEEHAGEAAAAAGAEDDEGCVGGEVEEVFGGVAGDLDEFGVVAAAGVDCGAEFGVGEAVEFGAGWL